MTPYKTVLDEIYDLQKFAIKLGLHNIRALSSALGNPHQAYPSIHIAGTNGKGSTAFFVAGVLQAMGLRVGLFTSPHLYDFRERIRVNEDFISKAFIVDFWQRNKGRVITRKATFFDTTTAMAFDYFREQKVDVAVVETGLGGRLDSTNILQPEIAVLTPISFDHQKQLGDSLCSIAIEKAGIIKKDSAVFSARQEEETLQVLRESAAGARAFYYLPHLVATDIRAYGLEEVRFTLQDKQSGLFFDNLTMGQIGDFQVDNLALAYLVSSYYLKSVSIPFDGAKFRQAIQSRIWPGRLQLVRKNPPVMVDVSHNLQGIRRSLSFLSKALQNQKLVVLAGLVQDKDYEQIAVEISRYAARVIITEPDTHRKLSAEALRLAFADRGMNAQCIQDIDKAYEFSVNSLAKNEILLVMGSHYLVGSLKDYKLI